MHAVAVESVAAKCGNERRVNVEHPFPIAFAQLERRQETRQDHEVELVVALASGGRDIAEADARNAPLRSNPDFVRMYDGTATSPTENIDLLGQHFRTQHFEGMARVPSYVRWWQACDMVPAYRHLERVLRLLQWRCPPDRWHLKSPPDLGCLDAIARVFPDARFVWTHRDPAKVLASVCKLISFIRRMQSDAVDDHEKMIAALLKRDGPALGQVLRFHLERTWDRVRNVLGVTDL